MSQKQPSASAGSFRFVLGTAALLLVTALAVAGIQSYRDLVLRWSREADLERQIRETDERIEELSRTVELLRSDPATLEKVARETLGMSRPGDVVVLLEQDDSKAPQSSKAP
jgi:cell division protein FtsB